MSIYITNDSKLEYNFDYKKLIKDVINKSLEYINCPYEVEVNVLLTNNDEIHLINKEYRDIDNTTDVLSFPMIDYNIPGDFSELEESNLECFNLDTGELVLGDIIVSSQKVYEQANSYGHNPQRELGFLIAHSMFHLFGFDHLDNEERVHMEKMQEKVLEELNITRIEG